MFDSFDEAVDEMFDLLRDREDAIRIDTNIDTPKSRTIIYILDCNSGVKVGVWCSSRGANYEERQTASAACSKLAERLLRNGNIVRDRWNIHMVATHMVYHNHCPYYMTGDDHDATIAALRLDGRWERV